MSNKSEIEFDIVGIGYQLKNFRFYVPRYQRSYAWKREQVNDLYKDVYSAFDGGQKEYFLGSIVVTKEEEGFEVIDGQQRLATITIFIAAIRNYYQNIGDRESVLDIEKDYLFNRDFTTKEKLPRLKLGKADNDFFLKTIIQLDTPSDLASTPKVVESHDNIKIALQTAEDFVATIVKPQQNPHILLSKFLEYIQDSVKVVRVDVPDYSDAFTIFETLNARGLDLTESDLIKNHLFLKATKDRIDEVENRWTSMTAVITSVANEQEVISFIKYFYTSKYEPIRKKNLYKKIKERTINKQDAVDFAFMLEENSKRYIAILNSTDNYWNDFSNRSRIRKYVQILNDFGIIHSRPLLLAILEHFDKTEIEKSLKLLVSWSVRFLISGSVSSGTFENQFSQKAIDVRNGFSIDKSKIHIPIKTANDLSMVMGIVPSDIEFEESFADARILSSKFARYILRTLEDVEKGEIEVEKNVNPDESDVNLEHVLPKNPSSNWGNLTDEEAEAFYSRIGNLALLQKTPNLQIGNSEPSDKAKVLSDSEIILTQKIGLEIKSSGSWGVEQIKNRQEYLAKLALKAWTLTV